MENEATSAALPGVPCWVKVNKEVEYFLKMGLRPKPRPTGPSPAAPLQPVVGLVGHGLDLVWKCKRKSPSSRRQKGALQFNSFQDHPSIGKCSEAFLKGYRGYLQADAYGGYDAFFKNPARGLIEVGCWAHARRHLYKALESDQARMGPALLLIAQLYRVEQQAQPMAPEDRLQLRQRQSRPILDKLRDYLEEIQVEVLPKSPEGRAVRYALKNWIALARYREDGDLEIDNNATERSIRSVAVGRRNWIFFGSDQGGKTAAVLRSFVASCQRAGVEPFAWFKDVLPRIASHPINRIAELLLHNWAPAQV